MFPTAEKIAKAIVTEIPDLPPLAAQSSSAAFFVGQAADRIGRAAATTANSLAATADLVTEETRPLIADAREAVSAWKTAGQAVSITCVTLAIVAVVGLIVFTTWKPEEFR